MRMRKSVLLFTTMTLVVLLASSVALAAVFTEPTDCVPVDGGVHCEWNGTPEDDEFYGTGGPDTMYGYSGSDKMYGRGGKDDLDGGAGADTISGAGGDDFMLGSSGADMLRGGALNDIVAGHGGRDRLYGDLGEDFLAAKDGLADRVIDCGPDWDQVSYDVGLDPAPIDCEVHNPPAG